MPTKLVSKNFTEFNNGIQGIFKNCNLLAPGLAISAGGSPNPKTSNTFAMRCGQGLGLPAVFSAPVTTKTFNGIAGSANPSITTSAAGTTVIKDGFSRIYTLLANVSTVDGTVIFSWVNSADIDTHRGPLFETDFSLGGYNQVIVATMYIKWEPNDGTTFTPGTTALDASGVTVIYSDVWGWVIG